MPDLSLLSATKELDLTNCSTKYLSLLEEHNQKIHGFKQILVEFIAETDHQIQEFQQTVNMQLN